jgi:hypothetical protein
MGALAWGHPYVGWPAALALTLFTLPWLAIQRLVGDRARVAGAIVAVLAVFGAFGWAELGLKRAFASEGSEIALLPNPANPFCWTVLAAGFRGDRYRAAAWKAAPWPTLVRAESCRGMLREALPDLVPLGETPGPARAPVGAFLGTRAEYDEIARSCRARAYFRFARIPVWKIGPSGINLGDLRFDGAFRLSSAGEASCPSFEPPWTGRFYPSAP